MLDGILVGSGDLRFLARAMAGICLVMILGEPIVLWLGGGMGWLWAVFIAVHGRSVSSCSGSGRRATAGP